MSANGSSLNDICTIWGDLVSEQDIQPLLEKILAITNLSEPKNVDELYHFLGLIGYHRKFVP